jgi:ribosomal protein S18 acetylase RimI-like enzyme
VTVKLVPATALELGALAELFTACFADYAVAMRMDAGALREHVESNGIDLDCSRVVVEERPAAFALIARRKEAGWVGGMGTMPSHRRRGLGAEALVAGIEVARDRGCRSMWLEVIDSNRAAAQLYAKLGFEIQRELIVWFLPATGNDPPPARAVAPDAAHTWIVATRRSREPWQRADETLANLRASRIELRGLVIERDGSVVSAVVFREDQGKVNVLQIAASDEASATEALLAAAGGRQDLRLANVPADEASSRALRSLGAQAVVTQHEMLLRL